MNIHHLELFYYVARNGGIKEAVRNMPYGIQQPAISGQILVLEADLGLKLFNRRPFELTPAGRELYEFISPFFGNVDLVGEKLRGGTTQMLRMAAPAMVLRDHLPELLQPVKRKFPRLKLTLRTSHQPQTEQLLERQEIDFAVTLLEGRPPAGFGFEPLVTLTAVLLVAPDARWKTAEEVLDDVASGASTEPLITLPANETLPRLFRDFLALRGLEWPPGIEVTGLELIDVYVAGGFGIGLGFSVPGVKPTPGLRSLPLTSLAPMTIGALWRGSPTPVIEELLRALRARAALISRSGPEDKAPVGEKSKPRRSGAGR